MLFKNNTYNSIYLEDINRHIPYSEDSSEYISSEDILKSKSFQTMFRLGAFDMLEVGNSRIERNLEKMYNKINKNNKRINNDSAYLLTESGHQMEVTVKGHFYDAGGYAKVNRNLVRSIHAAGSKVKIFATNSLQNDLNELEIKNLNSMQSEVGPKAIAIDSVVPSFSAATPNRAYNILYTTVEAQTVPKQTVDVCNRYQEVWVTSDFCKKVLKSHGVERNIFVMPPAIDTGLYHENHHPHEFRPKLKSFTFVSVFGWAYRKGYDALLKSYLRAFSSNDDVSLLIISRYQQSSKRSDYIRQEIDNYIKKYGGDNAPHIARCSRVIPEYQMPSIYRACDCFVLPSRGEGFGLPYCESSLCGLPVIATNHSGQSMFLNKDNSMLVDIDSTEKVQRGSSNIHYWDGHEMASLKSEDFINRLSCAMIDLYECYPSYKKYNKILQSHILDNYSINACSKRYTDRLKEIWSKM